MVQPVDRGFNFRRGRVTLTRRPDVFLCHSSTNKEFAKEVAGALTKFGVDPFLDAWEIAPGDSLGHCLRLALEKSKFVAVMMSPALAQSKWCIDELTHAQQREARTGQKVIIPIMHQDVTATPALSDRLYIDFRPSFFVAITRLCQIVHELSLRRIDDALATHAPENMYEVGKILESCGWNSTSLLDRVAYNEFARSLDKFRIPHSTTRDGIISFDPDDLNAHRAKIGRLEAIKSLEEIYTNPRVKDNILTYLESLDPSAHETLPKLIAALRDAQILTMSEIADVLELTKPSLARLEQNNSTMRPFMRVILAKRLLAHIASLNKGVRTVE